MGSKFFSIFRQVGSSSFGLQVSIKVVSTLSVVSDVVPNHSNRIKKFWTAWCFISNSNLKATSFLGIPESSGLYLKRKSRN